MPDLPIELSAAALPVPVMIALALVIVVVPACMYVWRRLSDRPVVVQTPAAIREAAMFRRILVYLAVSALVVAFMVCLVFIAILTWNTLNSLPDSAPDNRHGDSARLNRFPAKEHQRANPYDGGDGEANGAD